MYLFNKGSNTGKNTVRFHQIDESLFLLRYVLLGFHRDQLLYRLWLFHHPAGFKIVTVVTFSLAFEGNGRRQSGELTRQFDSSRTLIFIANAAGSAFNRIIIDS